LGYTSALGITELREGIAASYGRYPDVGGRGTVDPDRVVVVTGSSAGFLLVFTAAFDPGGRSEGWKERSEDCIRDHRIKLQQNN
jgi:aspartate/methionine/tyrosine aminotransferase